VDLIERGAEIVSDGNASLDPKTAGNSEEQRAASLLFRHSIAREPRISAENERLLADNFMPKPR